MTRGEWRLLLGLGLIAVVAFAIAMLGLLYLDWTGAW